MIKHYCDHCGTEITDANRPIGNMGRVSGHIPSGEGLHTFHVEVLVGVDGVWNKGDYCAPCIVEVVTQVANQRKCSCWLGESGATCGSAADRMACAVHGEAVERLRQAGGGQ